MRIAVFHNLPSGGAQRALFQLVKELSSKHHIDEYRLSTAVDFLPIKDYVKNTYVYAVDSVSRPRLKPYLLYCFAGVIKRIREIRALEKACKKAAGDINKGGYDIAYVDLSRITHSPAVLRYLKIPKLYYCHDPKRSILEGNDSEYQKPKGNNFLKDLYIKMCYGCHDWRENITNAYDKKTLKFADFIVTNSYYTREYIHKVYGSFAHVNYLGVDTDLFKKVDVSKKNYILSVGRIYRVKGHHYIVQALGLIPKEHRPSLKIVGSGTSVEEESYLVNLAKANDVQMEFIKDVNDEILVRMYNEALCVVYVPIMEPFGFVPLEAMACGTPVIGVREGGIRESIIHEETGLLVSRDDQELADAIERLITDKYLQKKLNGNVLDYVQTRWTWKSAGENMEKNIQKCIAQFNGGRHA